MTCCVVGLTYSSTQLVARSRCQDLGIAVLGPCMRIICERSLRGSARAQVLTGRHRRGGDGEHEARDDDEDLRELHRGMCSC